MLFRTLASVALCLSPVFADEPLASLLEDLVASGDVVGAQVLTGRRKSVVNEAFVGVVAPDSDRSVNDQTQFCIGSTSKPIASAVILSLVAEGKLDLDGPVSQQLPHFDPELTLRHLLSHHGGIYSQRNGLSDNQRRWIRDFRLTLDQAVNGIAEEDPIGAPGERFAYSGAGYCVIGRIAEVASKADFNTLVQRRVAGPLGMSRTTYFPNAEGLDIEELNVASGGSSDTPHLLGDELRLPLIGGSLYSTTRDLSRFAQMMIGLGSFGSVEILPPRLWREMITQPDFSSTRYALGWGLRAEPTRIRHSGALATSRAVLEINLDSGRYAIVLYSLAEFSKSVQDRIAAAVAAAI